MIDARDSGRDPRFDDQPSEPFDFDGRVATAEAEANAAQLTESLTQIIGGHHQVMAGFRRFETLLAEKALNDSQHAAALAKLVVKPADLWRASFEGANEGAGAAYQDVIDHITKATQRVSQVEARLEADSSDRLLERARWIRWTSIAAVGAVIGILFAGVAGEQIGENAGRSAGYARARDESAAASWANTEQGKFARALDRDGLLRGMLDCSGKDYARVKDSNGTVRCQATFWWNVQR